MIQGSAILQKLVDTERMAEENYSGQRLSFSGDLCTVRYIGPVSKTNGDWLGVEWDDANRGKHNGSHDGVKYFDC